MDDDDIPDATPPDCEEDKPQDVSGPLRLYPMCHRDGKMKIFLYEDLMLIECECGREVALLPIAKG